MRKSVEGDGRIVLIMWLVMLSSPGAFLFGRLWMAWDSSRVVVVMGGGEGRR